jgi:hypothetical protein
VNADFSRVADVPHVRDQPIVDTLKFSVYPKARVSVPLNLNGACNESVSFGLEVEVGDQVDAPITNGLRYLDAGFEKLTDNKVGSGKSDSLSVGIHSVSMI